MGQPVKRRLPLCKRLGILHCFKDMDSKGRVGLKNQREKDMPCEYQRKEMSYKTDFRTKNITRDEEHSILIKESSHGENMKS